LIHTLSISNVIGGGVMAIDVKNVFYFINFLTEKCVLNIFFYFSNTDGWLDKLMLIQCCFVLFCFDLFYII